MTTPTPQETAFKQALRDHVNAASSRRSGMTQAKLALEANVGASTLSKAITPGSNYMPPADITRDIVTVCLRHGPRTLTDIEIETEVTAVERLRRAAKDAETALPFDPAANPDQNPPTRHTVAEPDEQTTESDQRRHNAPDTHASPPGAEPDSHKQGNRNTTTLVVVALAVLALLVVVITKQVLLRPDAPPPGPALGLDLVRFCDSYGLTISGETCVAEIDLTRACNWERGRTDLKGIYRSDDPHSGECLTPDNKSVGGIREMTSSSCGKDYPDLPITAVILNNHRWACSLKIDMNVACAWQYSKLDLTATKDNDNIWSCT